MEFALTFLGGVCSDLFWVEFALTFLGGVCSDLFGGVCSDLLGWSLHLPSMGCEEKAFWNCLAGGS